MRQARDFIASYGTTDRDRDRDRDRIRFAWNGKHVDDFHDANEQFRWSVVQACLAAPETPSVQLLEHLFEADCAWTVQAWGSPLHLGQLGQLLLMRGQARALDTFALGCFRSFDTYGGCTEIVLPREVLARLIARLCQLLALTADKRERKRLKEVRQYFFKMRNSTVALGWGSLR